MDAAEFRKFGRAAVDFIADYFETIRDRPVLPSVEPGYIQKVLPSEAPETPERWEDIMKDVDNIILPGMTHWQSPHFHAYYPTAVSYPSIVGEMLCSGLACVGFSWIASPVCTELEVATMDWLGKLLDLPEEFLHCSKGPGGGVIQGSASESTLVALLAAKERTVRRLRALHPDWEEGEIKARLVAYTSDQANSSVEKGGLLASMTMRLLPTDDKCRLRGHVLEDAIRSDLEKGLLPCCVIATLGTTPTCAFDCLEEIGPICQQENIWLHIDAAYAGSAFACPEFRHLMGGVQMADSFNFNPHKWMLVNFDCSAMWVKDSRYLVEAFNVERIYLAHENEGKAPDYRHWQIPLGRRFRALKVWIVLRTYGVEGIREHIRRHVGLAKQFEAMVRTNPRFEIASETSLGLVCFRLKGPNSLTKELLDRITARKRIYLIAGTVRKVLVIRFVVCSIFTELRDIEFAWNEICDCLSQMTEVGLIHDNHSNLQYNGETSVVTEKLSTGHSHGTCSNDMPAICSNRPLPSSNACLQRSAV